MPVAKAEDLREQAFSLTCHEQFRLATFIAANVGYVLAPEPQIDREAGFEQRLDELEREVALLKLEPKS